MQISNFAFLVILCMSLFVPAAMAEDISVPDQEHRQGMSYEEYSTYRAKMRMQMENKKPEDLKPNQMEKRQRDSAYGKGYHMRNPSEGRPDIDAGSRPERPRAERFNRGSMGRR